MRTRTLTKLLSVMGVLFAAVPASASGVARIDAHAGLLRPLPTAAHMPQPSDAGAAEVQARVLRVQYWHHFHHHHFYGPRYYGPPPVYYRRPVFHRPHHHGFGVFVR